MQGCILTTVFAIFLYPAVAGDDKEQIKLTRIANLESRIVDCHYSASLKSYLVATARRVHVLDDGAAAEPSVLHELRDNASACWIDETNGLVMVGISLQEFGKVAEHKLVLIGPDGGLRELEIPGSAGACIGGGVISTAGDAVTMMCVFQSRTGTNLVCYSVQRNSMRVVQKDQRHFKYPGVAINRIDCDEISVVHSNGFEFLDPIDLSQREFINCDGARVGRFTPAFQCIGTGHNVEFRLKTRVPVIHPRLYAKDFASLPMMTIAVGYFVHIFDKDGQVLATRRLPQFTFDRVVVRPGTSSGLVCSSNADLFILDLGGITSNGPLND